MNVCLLRAWWYYQLNLQNGAYYDNIHGFLCPGLASISISYEKYKQQGKSFLSQGACDFNVAARQGLKQQKQLPNALLLILKTNYVNDENAIVQEN